MSMLGKMLGFRVRFFGCFLFFGGGGGFRLLAITVNVDSVIGNIRF